MIIKDVFPAKSQFSKDESIELFVVVDSSKVKKGYYLECMISNLGNHIYKTDKCIPLDTDTLKISFDLPEISSKMMGYNVCVNLKSGDHFVETVYTAFDRVQSWTCAPRYGFLSDFYEQDEDDESDVIQMNKYHLNVVQFYDWMYRHYKLIPPEEYYVDPLGRHLSIKAVKNKIDYCHKYGMKAFAYGCVYASQLEFAERNKDMQLYNNDGSPASLGNLFFIMDISRENKWHDYIIAEFSQAIDFGFDGIHMDQYGQPKEAISIISGTKKIRRLKDDFYNLINDSKKLLTSNNRNASLIFNAVNNWPIETVAKSDEDCIYIEVWPPNDTYNDLYSLITNAKKLCGNKQVILAAYMAPFLNDKHTRMEFARNATILTMAAIFASGGFHLLLGEKNGILREAYYVNYSSENSESFVKTLRNYYDFIVAYEELLYDCSLIDNTMTYNGGINNEYMFKALKSDNSYDDSIVFLPKAKPNCVWTIVKEKPGAKIIHLLNYVGINNIEWNTEKSKMPTEIENIEVDALVVENVKKICYASPDFNNGQITELNFEYVKHSSGKAIRFNVPKLRVWDMIYIICD